MQGSHTPEYALSQINHANLGVVLSTPEPQTEGYYDSGAALSTLVVHTSDYGVCYPMIDEVVDWDYLLRLRDHLLELPRPYDRPVCCCVVL